MIDDLGARADVNLADAWRNMGSQGGAVGAFDTLVLSATGIPTPFFNGAYTTARTADPEAAVRAATEFMAAQGVPWLLWVREGVDDELVAAGRAAGLREVGGPPGMGLAPIPTPPLLPDGLEIEILTDPADLPVHWDLAARGFGMPVDMCARLTTPELLASPSIAVAVGRVDGVPVSTALLYISGTTAGVYTVATPAEHQRRGYGAALTWAVVEEGRRRGCDHAVLQASTAGRPVYAAMGFVDVGTYIQLEGPPATS